MMKKKIGIVMGSDSDLPVIEKATDTLSSLGVPFEVHVFSAHRPPDEAGRPGLNIFCESYRTFFAHAIEGLTEIADGIRQISV